MKEDVLEIEILADGTVKITTDTISPANHINADQLLKFLSTLTGGEVTKAKNRKSLTHTHQHDRAHH